MHISVLLIDDDEATCNIFKMVLEGHHYVVVTMRDGESALSFLDQGVFSPDVIVLDIFLPGLSGYEMLPRLRPLTNKVIATTSYYTSGSSDDLLERGFDGVLFKPLDVGQLVPYLEKITS